MNFPQPVHRYDFEQQETGALPVRGSGCRRITCAGRTGINVVSIRGRIPLPQHTADRDKGTVSIWLMPLDDLNPATHHPQHSLNNVYHDCFQIIGDNEAVGNFKACSFGITYSTDWHPVFYAKLFQGSYSEGGFGPVPKVVVSANYFTFAKLEWYLVSLTWDKTANEYGLYVNGILVGSPDRYMDSPLLTDASGPVLFLGCPIWTFSEVTFFDVPLTGQEIVSQFATGSRQTNSALQQTLRQIYAPSALPELEVQLDADWHTQLALPMNAQDTLANFYLQGCASAPKVTNEGLRITTPRALKSNYAGVPVEQQTAQGLEHIYLWTQKTFEGDIYITYDFKIFQHGGLSLLMAQCAGMQREDFLADYPLRTHGTMKSVCWEDIRNYHWEYFREMHDTRHDVVSHAMLKNPWYRPLAFQTESRTWNLDQWYRLEFWQVGPRIRGAIDGLTVIDVTDRPDDNNGPILNSGRVALRCMFRTDLVVRNFVVKSRTPFHTQPIS